MHSGIFKVVHPKPRLPPDETPHPGTVTLQPLHPSWGPWAIINILSLKIGLFWLLHIRGILQPVVLVTDLFDFVGVHPCFWRDPVPYVVEEHVTLLIHLPLTSSVRISSFCHCPWWHRRRVLALCFYGLLLWKYHLEPPSFVLWHKRANAASLVWAVAFKPKTLPPPLPQAICTTASRGNKSKLFFFIFW